MQLSYKLIFMPLAFLCLTAMAARAQQPFTTDNSDVTDRNKYHFQFGNEYDILQRSSYPALRQNTSVFELDYGLLNGVEVGVDGPIIAISNSHVVNPRTLAGIGDLDFHVKYNFHRERESSRWPAMTVSFSTEFPTGSTSKQLGSGLQDYFINGILQKSLTPQTKLRLNGGVLFAGNATTGVIGIKTRGRVYLGSVSLVKQFTERLDLGAEMTGGLTGNLQLGKGQLQGLVGGNYALRKNLTLDFGLVAGRFSASPRAGIQLGLSLDF
ncbi:MAG TPA: hypothetical protein VGO91_05430 [Pyrinomonadaceae bacterium]|jgi:hypothetical protein|nr:hypothetical protein [Pyrinomonadaceae bacterium]